MITGYLVHKAYCAVRGVRTKRWSALAPSTKRLCSEMARELNAHLKDEITITAVRCPHCKEMLEVAHAESHACWVKGES